MPLRWNLDFKLWFKNVQEKHNVHQQSINALQEPEGLDIQMEEHKALFLK